MADIKKVSISGTQYDIRDANAIEKGYAVNDFATNCITQIPQDINIVVSGNTVTLKSGSTVIVPSTGTQYQTAADMSATFSKDGKYYLIGAVGVNVYNWFAMSSAGSGSSLPADGSTYAQFFNTTDLCYYTWSGGAWTKWREATAFLPVAIISVSSGVVSIDQVFNGAGYIGHHAFVLPGVKGLIGNGLNTDGTLKVTSKKVSALVIADMTAGSTYNTVFINTYSGQAGTQVYGGEVDTINDFPSDNVFYFAKMDNMPGRKTSGGVLQGNPATPLAHYTQSSGTITSFNILPVSGLSHNYIQNALTGVSGYASNKTQTLKHVNGVLTFVDG